MKLTDIPTPPIDRHSPAHIKYLRRNAPRYLKSLVEKSFIFIDYRSLESLKVRDVKLMHGGLNAVVYMIKKKDDFVLVKLDYQSIRAEAEALEAWNKRGAKVVGVKSTGIMPGSPPDHPIKYIILEGVVDANGKPAPLAIEYAKKYPERTKSIGRSMGRELAIMHGATSKRTFGEFADMTGENTKPYKSWNVYLRSYLKTHHQNLLDQGYSKAQLRLLRRYLASVHFPKIGRYLHGDFSLRNTIVQSARPLQIYIIDPNPLIGNFLWDLAIVYNNHEFARRKFSLQPTNQRYRSDYQRWHKFLTGIKEGYAQGSSRRIDIAKLQLTQLIQMVFLLFAQIEEATKAGRDPATDIEVKVRQQALSDYFSRVLGEVSLERPTSRSAKT